MSAAIAAAAVVAIAVERLCGGGGRGFINDGSHDNVGKHWT